jgi:hypothetical protein
VPAVLALGPVRWPGSAATLSFGGAFFLAAHARPPVGGEGRLTLATPLGPLVFTCLAVRAGAGGAGLRFLATDAAGLARYTALMGNGSDVPDRLLEEVRVTPGFVVVTEGALRSALE